MKIYVTNLGLFFAVFLGAAYVSFYLNNWRVAQIKPHELVSREILTPKVHRGEGIISKGVVNRYRQCPTTVYRFISNSDNVVILTQIVPLINTNLGEGIKTTLKSVLKNETLRIKNTCLRRGRGTFFVPIL